MKNTINLRMAFFGLPAYNVIDEPQRNTASMPMFRLGGIPHGILSLPDRTKGQLCRKIRFGW